MNKVALYARVSLEEGDKSDRRYQEPENQLEPLRDWANKMGWTIVQEYVDRGSGADPNRPNFRKMLQDAMVLRFDTILVWKLDRFSRENLSNVIGRIQKLRERRVGIKSLTENWVDTGIENPMSELVLAVMAWSASEERRKISERTKVGIQRRKNLGVWKGGRPVKVATPDQINEIRDHLIKGLGVTTIMRKTRVGKKTIQEIKDELKGGIV